MIFGADHIAKSALIETENIDGAIAQGAEFFRNLQAVNGQPAYTPPTVPTWPPPVAAEGYYGIAGEIIRAIGPHSESDPAGLLLQFLTAWGSLAGRGPYYLAEDDRHHTNLYTVIVGITSKGRKGTSWGRMRRILGTLDDYWVANCLLSGIGSGEALIDALNHEDHRRLVVESEFPGCWRSWRATGPRSLPSSVSAGTPARPM